MKHAFPSCSICLSILREQRFEEDTYLGDRISSIAPPIIFTNKIGRVKFACMSRDENRHLLPAFDSTEESYTRPAENRPGILLDPS